VTWVYRTVQNQAFTAPYGAKHPSVSILDIIERACNYPLQVNSERRHNPTMTLVPTDFPHHSGSCCRDATRGAITAHRLRGNRTFPADARHISLWHAEQLSACIVLQPVSSALHMGQLETTDATVPLPSSSARHSPRLFRHSRSALSVYCLPQVASTLSSERSVTTCGGHAVPQLVIGQAAINLPITA
jgi:hypothetical protein